MRTQRVNKGSPKAGLLPKLAAAMPSRSCPQNSIISALAVGAFAPFVAFLRLHRKGCDRPRIEPLQADRLAGFFAIAIRAIIKPFQRRVDLCDQLALPVARPQFDGPAGLGRGAIGEIGMVLTLSLQYYQGFLALAQDIFFPGN